MGNFGPAPPVGATVTPPQLNSSFLGNISASLSPARPMTKAECKKGGWKRFTNPSFKNQGQCVKFVNHQGGKSNQGKDDNKSQGKKKTGKKKSAASHTVEQRGRVAIPNARAACHTTRPRTNLRNVSRRRSLPEPGRSSTNKALAVRFAFFKALGRPECWSRRQRRHERSRPVAASFPWESGAASAR